MRYLVPLLVTPLMIAPLAFAHPVNGTKPGDDPQTAVHTGDGPWSYEAVPHWGELPTAKSSVRHTEGWSWMTKAA